MFFRMAEYCDTLQSKEKRNREHKVCINERAILRLLDQEFGRKKWHFPARGKGAFSATNGLVGPVRKALNSKTVHHALILGEYPDSW